MVQYKSGQHIPSNVLYSVFYLSKVGILSTEQWHRQFGRGNIRWRQRQLKALVHKKFIKRHTSERKGYWVLNTEGERLAIKDNRSVVLPVQPTFFEHDSTMGESLYNLEGGSICNTWMTERELKTGNYTQFRQISKEGKVKYPDGICTVKVKGEERQVALEYERTGKSLARYREILSCYSTYTALDLIIFIAETDAIRRRIEKAQKLVNSEFLRSRIAYVGVDAWRKDPVNAKLDLNGRIFSLGEICERYDSRPADH